MATIDAIALHAAAFGQIKTAESETDKMRAFILSACTEGEAKKAAGKAVTEGFKAAVVRHGTLEYLIKFLSDTLAGLEPASAKRGIAAVNKLFSPFFYFSKKGNGNFNVELAKIFRIDFNFERREVYSRNRLGLLEGDGLNIGLVPVKKTSDYLRNAGRVVAEYAGLVADDESLPDAAAAVIRHSALWLAHCQHVGIDPETGKPKPKTKPKTKVKTQRERAA